MQISIKVSNSLNEPLAMVKNWTDSFFHCLAAPSAILAGIDTAARLIWDDKPYFSLGGREFVAVYIILTNLIDCFQTSRFLWHFFMVRG